MALSSSLTAEQILRNARGLEDEVARRLELTTSRL